MKTMGAVTENVVCTDDRRNPSMRDSDAEICLIDLPVSPIMIYLKR